MTKGGGSERGKILAVSMMKDEAPFLLEWFAHHLAIGFEDILVYTNDCTDGTDVMLKRLQKLGLGHHRDNVIVPPRKPQPSALKHANTEDVIAAADWVMVFDADEFLVINHDSGGLPGMIDAAGDANGIVVTWRIFGSDGKVEWSRDPVSEQYLSAAPHNWEKGWGVKTLFRYDRAQWLLGIHRPKLRQKAQTEEVLDSVKWLNGSGRPMEEYFKVRGWRSIRRTVGFDWAQMNHYAVKSIDSYALRRFRGNVNNKKDKYNADYWALQDRNEVRDEKILRHKPERERIMAELLADPVLSQLHHEALERAEAKLDAFRKTEDYAEFVEGLQKASAIPIDQVNPAPPKPRDPARIAAIMAKAGRTADGGKADDGANGAQDLRHPGLIRADKRKLPDGLEHVDNSGLLLPIAGDLFTAGSIRNIQAGKYNRRLARLLPPLIGPRERLMCFGDPLGMAAMLACKTSPHVVALSHESNRALTDMARKIAEANGLNDTARLKLVNGPLFLPSDGADQAGGLNAYAEDFIPTALYIDDPRLTPAMLRAALPPHVRTIFLMEAFLTAAPEDQRRDLVVWLKAKGFTAEIKRADTLHAIILTNPNARALATGASPLKS